MSGGVLWGAGFGTGREFAGAKEASKKLSKRRDIDRSSTRWAWKSGYLVEVFVGRVFEAGTQFRNRATTKTVLWRRAFSLSIVIRFFPIAHRRCGEAMRKPGQRCGIGVRERVITGEI